jgi:hypothetical protein
VTAPPAALANFGGEARAAASAAMPDDALIALLAAPLWTQAALVAVAIPADALLGPLVTRDGRGDDLVVAIAAPAIAPVADEVVRRAIDAAAAVQRLAQAAATCAELPPVLARWTELAGQLAGGAAAVADALLAEVSAACAARTPGVVLDRIEAAAALARAIGGPVAVAVRICRHRVEYAYRVARDQRALRGFVDRPEAMAAFARLLDGDGPWALHFLGVGGVGKSTLLRHLATADDKRPGLATARIDFDYLSAAYPARDPGRLLEAIVHDLSMQIGRAAQDRLLTAIGDGLAVVRELGQRGDLDWRALSETSEFRGLLGDTGALLASFGRPLLILDTCEELMKLAPLAGRVPSVDAMFALIEALHERVPTLRVIFAGRRLLAERGHGWHATEPSLEAAIADPAHARRKPLSGERPYLALHELRGFTEDSARRVLATTLPVERRADAPLIDAILQAAPEDERVSGVVIDDAPVSDARFHSPFRIVALAEWVAGEPDLPAARLASGDVDVYIEQRIVQRMGALEPLLPAIAILRRFDAATLAAATGRTVGEAGDVLVALAGHEWIDVVDEPDRGAVVTAKPSVGAPLARYLAAARPAAWADARLRIAAGLAARLGEPGAIRLAKELVDAVLRALPAEAAAQAWLDLEQRIGDDWTSARTLASFLQGERNAAESPDTLLGLAVRATAASAVIHLRPTGDDDLRALWTEIEVHATAQLAEEPAGEAGPIASGARPAPAAWLLVRRARLGLAAERAWRHDPTGADDDLAAQVTAIDETLEELRRWNRQDALACPILAALEAVLEAAERTGATELELRKALAFAPAPTAGLAAFRELLRARWHALTDDDAPVLPALTGLDEALPATTLDWLPPTSLRARVALETLRLCFDRAEPRLAISAGADRDRDTEHLRAAVGLYDDARAPVPRPSGRDNRADLGPPLRSYAVHRRFPIGADLLAQRRDGRLPWDRARAAQPRVGSSTWDHEHVDTAGPNALGAAGPNAFGAAAARARFAMDPTPLASLRVANSAFATDVEVQRAWAVAWPSYYEAPPLDLTEATLLDRWSYAIAATRAQRDALVDAYRPHVAALLGMIRGSPLRERAGAAAMLEELVELSRYTAAPIIARAPDPLAGLGHVHPDDVEAIVRCGLRAWAARAFAFPPLEGAPAPIVQRLVDLRAIAPRRLAQLAYDEAQLLALRLPARAITLFELAAGSDHGDATLATLAELGLIVARRRADLPTPAPGAATPGRSLRPIPDPHLPLDPGARVAIDLIADPRGGASDLTGPLAARIRDAPLKQPPPFLAPFEFGERRAPPAWLELGSLVRAHGAEVALWCGVGAILAVVGVGGYYAFRWMTDWVGNLIAGDTQSAMRSTTGILVAILGAIVLIVKSVGFVRALLTPSPRARARRLRPDASVVRLDDRRARLTLTVAGAAPVTCAADLPRTAAYPTARPDDAVGLALALVRIGRLDDAYAPLPLRIDPALAGYGWEATLAELDHRLAANLEPVRIVAGPGRAVAAPNAGALVASAAVRTQLGKGLVGAGLVHAIGRPVRGMATIALDLGDDVGARGPMPASAIATSGTPLLVLQGASQASSEVPSEATRNEVVLLRELATIALRQGVAMVLVLPPVPVATMFSLIAAVQEALTGAPNRARAIAMARAARTHLAAIDDAAHCAAAREVTLFVTED